ncbi:MAG TPA: DciA family protein [Sphingomonas sp.]
MKEPTTSQPKAKTAGKAAARPDVPERKRGGAARAVADMLPDVGRAAFRRFGFVQSSVVTRWPEIVGDRYAGVSSPESIRFPQGTRSNGVLTLTVEGAHAVMMQHVAPAIVERVNRFFGYPAVARIAIRQGPAHRRRTPSPVRGAAPVSQEIGDSLRAIADPELRACLAGLAGALAATTGPPILDIPVMGKVR